MVSEGTHLGNLAVSLVNGNLPFPPANSQANQHFLVQISGGGTQFISGDSLEIVKLRFWVTGAYGDSLKLWLDGTPGRSYLTTINLTDIRDEALILTNGMVLVQDLTAPVSSISFPTPGMTLETDTLIIAGTADDGPGLGVKTVRVSVDSGRTWFEAQNTSNDFDTWEYRWTDFQTGDYLLISMATDSAGNVEKPQAAVNVQLKLPNYAPQLAAIPDTSAFEDQRFTFQVHATDENKADTLRYYDTTELFDIDPISGIIDFVPGNDQVGIHLITIIVSDGQLSDSTSFTLTIINVNDPPQPFALLQPPDEAVIDTLNPTVIWQNALDIDPGDSVFYELIVSTNQNFADTVLYAVIPDSFYVIREGLSPAKEYHWKVIARDMSEEKQESTEAFSFRTSDIATEIADPVSGQIPKVFHLSQNYPNPFNPETRIRFQLPKSSHVKLEIYNMLGQKIVTLIDEKRRAGYHEIAWNGRNTLGKKVPSGIYVLRLKAGEFWLTRKMIFAR